MDNKRAIDSFDLQPSQKVVQHGAGVVIVQTTRVKQRKIIRLLVSQHLLDPHNLSRERFSSRSHDADVDDQIVYVSDLAKKSLALQHTT